MKSEIHTCSNCGHQEVVATGNKYWHRLSPGLAGVLIKFRRAVRDKGANSIHLQRDMTGENELSKTEYANAQKLRYFGLIHHDTEAGAGYWLLTRRGRLFLDGDLPINAAVRTQNNEIIERDPDLVNIRQVAGQRPVFDDYAFWHSTHEVGEFAQLGMSL